MNRLACRLLTLCGFLAAIPAFAGDEPRIGVVSASVTVRYPKRSSAKTGADTITEVRLRLLQDEAWQADLARRLAFDVEEPLRAAGVEVVPLHDVGALASYPDEGWASWRKKPRGRFVEYRAAATGALYPAVFLPGPSLEALFAEADLDGVIFLDTTLYASPSLHASEVAWQLHVVGTLYGGAAESGIGWQHAETVFSGELPRTAVASVDELGEPFGREVQDRLGGRWSAFAGVIAQRSGASGPRPASAVNVFAADTAVDVRVTTEPAGAKVATEGIAATSTPFRAALPPGPREIEVTLDGYRSWSAIVALPPGAVFEREVHLGRVPEIAEAFDRAGAPSNRYGEFARWYGPWDEAVDKARPAHRVRTGRLVVGGLAATGVGLIAAGEVGAGGGLLVWGGLMAIPLSNQRWNQLGGQSVRDLTSDERELTREGRSQGFVAPVDPPLYLGEFVVGGAWSPRRPDLGLGVTANTGLVGIDLVVRISGEDEVAYATYAPGARVALPFRTYARGALLHQVSLEDDGTGETVATDRAWGAEVGGGVRLPLGPSYAPGEWALVPDVSAGLLDGFGVRAQLALHWGFGPRLR